MKRPFGVLYVLMLFFCSFYSLQAQTPQEQLIKKFTDYFSIPKEVAYLHLNKTVLLKGEQLGISAYVVGKSDLQPSVSTSNLYVQIRNSGGDIVREEVLLVENGTASSVYDIDSDFAPGDYTITAFTNWMRNFEERDYFTENIRVITSSLDHSEDDTNLLSKIDAQFLPESGHLLSNVLNHVGIIVKDRSGRGMPNASVVVKNNKGEIIGNVELNEFGIGKFSFTPQLDQSYNAIISFRDKEYPIPFNTPVDEQGIVLSATQGNSNLRLLVNTNSQTLEKLRDEEFLLVVQGRKTVETFSLKFTDRESIPLSLDLNKFDSGVNIVTLFSEDLQPVAERLVFNYSGLPLEEVTAPQIVANQDSLQVKFSFDREKDRMLSISVLPKNTLSYNPNHNIISYNLLQPYVNGTIENGGWYFENIDNRKKYNLDNLLITQGWSSYDWETIFNSDLVLDHGFENHFGFKAKINGKNKRDQRYVLHATSINPVDIFEVPEENEDFIYDGFKPLEGEKLIMSRLRKNNDLLPADLYLQFFPNKIPDFRPLAGPIPQRGAKVENTGRISEPAFQEDFMKGAEELGEVLLTATIDKEMERERKLDRSSTFSRVSMVKEEDLRGNSTLAQFLNSRGVRVYEESGKLEFADGLMTIFLDGQRILDSAYFYNYPLYLVDYVEIDKHGLSNSFSGGGPMIKVYTDFENRHRTRDDRTRVQEFELPLAYSKKKIFYTPKYENTSDKFFEEYGVIDWKPVLSSKEGDEITFIIESPQVDYQMIIEGFTSNGEFIHEVLSFPAAE